MGQDLNNTLGVPGKYRQSIFRSWNAGVSNPFVYSLTTPGNFINLGTAFTVQADDATNGFQLVINEPGIYSVQMSCRVNTNAVVFGVAKYDPSIGTNINSYIATSGEVLFYTVDSTTVRRGATGIIECKRGDVLMPLTVLANGLGGFNFSITKIAVNT